MLLRKSSADRETNPFSSCASMPKALMTRIPVIDCWSWSLSTAALSRPRVLTERILFPMTMVKSPARGAISSAIRASFQSR